MSGGSLDFSRWRSLVSVGAALLVAFGIVDVAFRYAFGMEPRSLGREENLDPVQFAAVAARVAAVENEVRTSGASDGLSIIVGFSTAREGLLAEVLERDDGQDGRWLNLGGSGASFHELEYYTRPLFRSSLRPRVVVMAVHPVHMAGRVGRQERLHIGPAEALTLLGRGDVGLVARGAREWSWFVFHRNAVSVTARRLLGELREDLMSALGVPLGARFPPAADPWAVERRYSGYADDAFVEKQLVAWRRFGWFEPSTYSLDDVETKALRVLLARSNSMADRVVLALLPERSDLRRLVPAAAEQALDAAASVAPGLQVVDLRGALADPEFYDRTHPNERGRAVVSRALAAALRIPMAR